MAKDGRVSNREAVVLGGDAGKKAWGGGGTRRSRGRGGSRQAAGRGSGGEGHVCTLVPGATAMFEVAATAPEEVVGGTVKMEVRCYVRAGGCERGGCVGLLPGGW